VPLPLVAFFFLAPIVFIVSHAYTLVHFVMLGAKVGVLDTELRAQVGDAPETTEGLRRQLPSNIFVQFLAGPRDIRKGALGLILKAIAWFSLVIGPVLLLLLLQVQFLPYHLEWLTWAHRLAILADVILLWALWPAVLESRSEITWPPLWRRPVLTLASLVPIGIAFTAATFPGERMEDWIGRWKTIPPNLVTAWLGVKDEDDKPIWTSFHDLLFNGKVEYVTRRRKSLFSNTLVLPHFDALEAAKIEPPKKLDGVKQTLVLRSRHLESAVFNSADLRKADLEGAQLQGALLDSAQLQGAYLVVAQLQGASLSGARLQGAWLIRASLQGASLDASLQGASLDSARLQGASLDSAQLQGASLDSASLQGASLDSARLQGASLREAQLQGADFQKSTLDGTDMSSAAVWRTNFENASLTAVFEDDLEESGISMDEFAALKAMIMKEVPEGQRADALKRIDKSNPDIFGPEASGQETLEKRRVGDITYKKSLAHQLKSLACSGGESAPYIVRGLIAHGRITDTGAQAPGLVEAILNPKCQVTAALTEADKAALKKIAKEASGAP
jgi:uncharacterized protein YjbI with pentapeptide repeats